MVVKKFYLSSESELQRIGLRAQIISFLMQNAVKEGNAVNDLTDRKKVIVAIKFDLNPPDQAREIARINEICGELVSNLNSLHPSDEVCYHSFPTDIQASELHNLDNPHSIAILSMQELSASLMLEQTSKGVGAMLSLGTAISPLAKLSSSIDSLAEKIERLSNK